MCLTKMYQPTEGDGPILEGIAYMIIGGAPLWGKEGFPGQGLSDRF